MKILTYKHGGETAVGVLKNDGSEVVPVNYLGCSAIDMNTFLDVQNEKKLEKLDRNKELMQGIPLDEVQILSPIPHPKQDVVCLGINYYAHAEEAARFHDEAFGGERPVPIYFPRESIVPWRMARKSTGIWILWIAWIMKQSWRLSSARMQGM